MGKLMLQVFADEISVRDGPAHTCAEVGKALRGQAFEVIHLLDAPGSPEQWARIEHPEFANAYLCTRLEDGRPQARAGMMIGPEAESAEFVRGWNAAVDAMHRALVPLRKQERP